MSIYSYLLITPDGQQWDLNEAKWQVDPGIPDGFDLPELAHNTQMLYNQPGAMLKSVQVQPRVVTITAKLVGSCRDELHQVRAALWQALRLNREGANPPSYSTLRYEANGRTVDLHCYFLSDVLSGGDGETNQAVGYKLIAYDPFWYDTTRHVQSLGDLFIAINSRHIISRIDGAWSVPGITGANLEVKDIAFDSTGRVYVTGWFTTIGGVAAKGIAYSDDNGATWNAMGSGLELGVNPHGNHLAIDSRDRVFVAGKFGSAGGVASPGIAYWDGAWHAMTGLVEEVNWVAISKTDVVYIGGLFTVGGGSAQNYIAYWNGAAWAAMGTGMNGAVYGLAFAPDGKLFVTGVFTIGNGVTLNGIGYWNGTTFVAMGSGLAGGTTTNQGNCVLVAKDGNLYLTGDFATCNGITCNSIARWNGTQWFPLSTGLTGAIAGALYGWHLNELADGKIFVGGSFLYAGGLALANCAACWNGTIFTQLDFTIVDGTSPIFVLKTDAAGNIWEGHAGNGTGYVLCSNTILSVTTNGDEETYPIFTVIGPCTLDWIENILSHKKMIFNLALNAGEIATIDLTPLVKSFSSNWRGNLFPYAGLLPASDFASWSLTPAPLSPAGVNTLNIYLINTTPVEENDNNNQLSGWASITGITYLNTDNGKLYVNIVVDGGGFYHVDLYDDAARTHLVGHTATYNSNGAKAIVADNASGLGGTVTVDARTAADVDIVVYFATARISWYDRFLSADSAVAPDRIR